MNIWLNNYIITEHYDFHKLSIYSKNSITNEQFYKIKEIVELRTQAINNANKFQILNNGVNDFQMLLLHGSRNYIEDLLDINKTNDRNPFGPGIYLTDDLSVARCYTKSSENNSYIYNVSISGNKDFAINLDLPYSKQPKNIQAILMNIKECIGANNHNHKKENVNAVLYHGIYNRKYINELLKLHGIWLVYGHLHDPYTNSGACDKGIQYVLLNSTKNFKLLKAEEERNQVTTIQHIRDKVNDYQGYVLDQKVMDGDYATINPIRFFVDFQNTDSHNIQYKNIPIKNIMFLNRSDGWQNKSQSWRELINTWIHGEDWDNNVFGYFESSIKDNSFPPKTSQSNLRVLDYCGIIKCDNGNHRLVGACCWMTCKNGDDAILLDVHCVETAKFKPFTRKLIEELKDDDEVYTLEALFPIDTTSKLQRFIKTVNKNLSITKLFQIIDDNIIDVTANKTQINLSGFDWKCLDKKYIEIWKSNFETY